MGPRREFVRRHAKAPSAGSTQATGNSRGLFRRALATRGASSDAKGSGAPSPRRAQACSPSSPSRSPPSRSPPLPPAPLLPRSKWARSPNVSYASAHVTGIVTSDGSGRLAPPPGASEILDRPGQLDRRLCDGLWNFPSSAHSPTNPSKPISLHQAPEKAGPNTSSASSPTTRLSRGPKRKSSRPSPTPPSPPSPSTRRRSPAPSKPRRSSPPRPKPPAKSNAPPTKTPPSTSTATSNTSPTLSSTKTNATSPQAGFEGATPVPCAQNPIKKPTPTLEKEVTANLTGLDAQHDLPSAPRRRKRRPGAVIKEARQLHHRRQSRRPDRHRHR